MKTKLLRILVLQLLVFGLLLSPSVTPFAAPSPQRTSGFRVREPNVYAPHLYADTLDVIATLFSLPGSTNKRSYWELSYQLYFVPEDKYFEALKRAPRGGSNPTPEEFPGRILLAQGHKKRMPVGTLDDRTIHLTGVRFKQKVADAQRTKWAYLLTAYSVKIFDAELNTTVYQSGIFLTNPYEDNSNDQKQALARKTIYLNFAVTPNGTLKYSQLRPKNSYSSTQ